MRAVVVPVFLLSLVAAAAAADPQSPGPAPGLDTARIEKLLEQTRHDPNGMR